MDSDRHAVPTIGRREFLLGLSAGDKPARA